MVAASTRRASSPERPPAFDSSSLPLHGASDGDASASMIVPSKRGQPSARADDQNRGVGVNRLTNGIGRYNGMHRCRRALIVLAVSCRVEGSHEFGCAPLL